MIYDICVWVGVIFIIEYSIILIIKISLKMVLVLDEICIYYVVFVKKLEINIMLILKSNG